MIAVASLESEEAPYSHRSTGVTMSTIDKQRIAAVRVLEVYGYTFAAGEWHPPATAAPSFIPSTDAMHGMLMRCADALVGCTEGSDEEVQLKAIVDAIEAYEAVRWPEGKIAGGKGSICD
jgi:hypothetical protein